MAIAHSSWSSSPLSFLSASPHTAASCLRVSPLFPSSFAASGPSIVPLWSASIFGGNFPPGGAADELYQQR